MCAIPQLVLAPYTEESLFFKPQRILTQEERPFILQIIRRTDKPRVQDIVCVVGAEG